MRFKACPACRALNPRAAVACAQCGASFAPVFTLTLDDALRAGAIIRGMDIEEAEVREAEQIAPIVRGRVLQSGDQTLIRVLRTLPDESWARLQAILTAARN